MIPNFVIPSVSPVKKIVQRLICHFPWLHKNVSTEVINYIVNIRPMQIYMTNSLIKYLNSWSIWIQAIIILFDRIGGESLCVAQNTYAVSWFKGRELNMVFGLQLSFSRVVSIYKSCYFYDSCDSGILANDYERKQDIKVQCNRLNAYQNIFLCKYCRNI